MELVKKALQEERHVYFDASLQEHVDACETFSVSVCKSESLQDTLTRVAFPSYFGEPSRTVLYKDFAPHSFGFSVQVNTENGWRSVMSGGIIWHSATEEWGVHT